MNFRLYGLAAAGLAAAVVLASGAFAAQVSTIQSHIAAAANTNRVVVPKVYATYKLSCVVRGTPVEFPDDIAFVNSGLGSVPVGVKVHWVVPGTQYTGNFTFTTSLAPNHQTWQSGVLGGGLEAGRECDLTILK